MKEFPPDSSIQDFYNRPKEAEDLLGLMGSPCKVGVLLSQLWRPYKDMSLIREFIDISELTSSEETSKRLFEVSRSKVPIILVDKIISNEGREDRFSAAVDFLDTQQKSQIPQNKCQLGDFCSDLTYYFRSDEAGLDRVRHIAQVLLARVLWDTFGNVPDKFNHLIELLETRSMYQGKSSLPIHEVVNFSEVARLIWQLEDQSNTKNAVSKWQRYAKHIGYIISQSNKKEKKINGRPSSQHRIHIAVDGMPVETRDIVINQLRLAEMAGLVNHGTTDTFLDLSDSKEGPSQQHGIFSLTLIHSNEIEQLNEKQINSLLRLTKYYDKLAADLAQNPKGVHEEIWCNYLRMISGGRVLATLAPFFVTEKGSRTAIFTAEDIPLLIMKISSSKTTTELINEFLGYVGRKRNSHS